MNTVRRDQSISPIDRSNTRIAAYRKPGEPHFGGAVDGCSARERLTIGPRSHQFFTRYLKTACRLSSGDVTSSTAPTAPLATRSVRPA